MAKPNQALEWTAAQPSSPHAVLARRPLSAAPLCVE
jgi:hypothetical protein